MEVTRFQHLDARLNRPSTTAERRLPPAVTKI
jgi:hypothetical protein